MYLFKKYEKDGFALRALSRSVARLWALSSTKFNST